MEQTKQPAQDTIRQSTHHLQGERKTPLSTEEIRRQLGWHLCHASSKQYADG